MLAAVPIKPFGVAKRRLSPVLDDAARSRLGKAIAANTLAVAGSVIDDVAVVTADPGVADWARAQGVAVIGDPGTGLDGAATAALGAAGGRWAIIHADLPMLSSSDVAALVEAVPESGVVLAPSADGGTNAIAGAVAAFAFSYGPGSFARHLAAAAALPHAIVSRPGLALDLDTPHDLDRARTLAGTAWLG